MAIEDVRRRVSPRSRTGANIIVLSDRNATAELAPIPSLLLTAAVHHHLVREKTRTRVGLVVETGEAREVHHMALLIGYGAAAVNPYLAFEIDRRHDRRRAARRASPRARPCSNYIKAACKGVLKVMSKMGISTIASYTGAQVFEAIGLDPAVVDGYFTGTSSRIGGVGLDVLAAEVAAPSPPGLRRTPDRAGPPRARGRRRVPVAPRGRVPPVQPARPCSSSSTPPGPSATTIFKEYTTRSTTSPSGWPRCGACCGSAPADAARPGADRGGRAGRARS